MKTLQLMFVDALIENLLNLLEQDSFAPFALSFVELLEGLARPLRPLLPGARGRGRFFGFPLRRRAQISIRTVPGHPPAFGRIVGRFAKHFPVPSIFLFYMSSQTRTSRAPLFATFHCNATKTHGFFARNIL